MAAIEGKVIIVTGAARGLGRTYAERLAADGATVIVGDVRDCAETVAAITDAGGKARAVSLDVADSASCDAMAAATIEECGRIDGIVNNAALYGGLSSGKADALDEDEWNRVMDINVTGELKKAPLQFAARQSIPAEYIRHIASVHLERELKELLR